MKLISRLYVHNFVFLGAYEAIPFQTELRSDDDCNKFVIWNADLEQDWNNYVYSIFLYCISCIKLQSTCCKTTNLKNFYFFYQFLDVVSFGLYLIN